MSLALSIFFQCHFKTWFIGKNVVYVLKFLDVFKANKRIPSMNLSLASKCSYSLKDDKAICIAGEQKVELN